ncbi:MAG: hypothetical protein WDZ30_05010 [Cellvibrionaceae bacterium]
MSRFAQVIFIFSIFCINLPSVLAASVAEEKERLAVLQQSINKEQTTLAELEAELESYPPKLSEATVELEAAQEELDTGEQELAKLRSEAKLDSSSELERQIVLQEHAVKMSERRLNRENRTVERLTRYRDGLQADIADAKANIAQLQQRVAQQTRRIADTTEAQPQVQKVGSPPPAVTPPPKIAAPAPLPPPIPTPEIIKADPEPPALSDQDYDAFEMARATMERVEQIAAGSQASPYYSNLELTGSDIESTLFTHLGANQYRADVVLPSGFQRFRIDNLRFRANISAENAGEVYVFIVDASDRTKLKANYFKQSLLSYVGHNPVRASTIIDEAEEEEPVKLVTLPSGESVAMSEEDAYALEIAREHTALLEDLAQEEETIGARFSELTISGSSLNTTPFEYVGHNQYRAEVTVQAGRQLVEINRGSFRIEIPDVDDGETYLFYVDASRRNRLQLTYYKKAILNYL